jgi:hypothetical protein
MTDKEKLDQIEDILNTYDDSDSGLIETDEILINLIRKTINGEIVKLNEEPDVEPECSASEEEIEETGIDCEFENRDGAWWCTTHNCHA